jgi:VanZ family protein
VNSRWWRAAFWAAAAFALVMALLPHPVRLPSDPSDKVQHIVAFLTLGALGRMAYAKASGWALLACLSLFGAAIELLQAIPALNRDSDVVDWLADTIAAGAAILAATRLRR